MILLLFYSFDASIDDGHFGRLINHSSGDGVNVHYMAAEANQRHHLYFVAARDLLPGEELFYCYGERRADRIKMNPWLKHNMKDHVC